MHRYFIQLAYNGKNYHGWQVQDNAITVQSVLDKALTTLLSEKIISTGAGRTDTGVHAREFFLHIDIPEYIDNDHREQLVYKLNSILPADISVFRIFHVKRDAHARFDAKSRTYKYWISRIKDPFNDEYSFYYSGDLDIKQMNLGASILLRYNDFSSFAKTGTQVKTNNCKISHAEWVSKGHLLIFTISADRFLRNMVRAIVGTLFDLGRGYINIDQLKAIIESKNRSEAGVSVPAKGLFLTKIEYPEELFISS